MCVPGECKDPLYPCYGESELSISSVELLELLPLNPRCAFYPIPAYLLHRMRKVTLYQEESPFIQTLIELLSRALDSLENPNCLSSSSTPFCLFCFRPGAEDPLSRGPLI
jgi:hypothetical protein